MSPLFIKLKLKEMKNSEKLILSWWIFVAIIVVGSVFYSHYYLEASFPFDNPVDRPLHVIELFAAILTTVLEWGLVAMLVATIILFLIYLTVELIPNKLWPAFKNWLDKYE